MRTKFRVILPVAFGILSAALMVWDIHNQRVISSMGMAWDTGAPLWPYQTPDTLLFALNTPTYLLANPVSNLLSLVGPAHYIVLYPTVILWWWFVGIVLDRKLRLPETRAGWRPALSSASAALFLIAGAYLTRDVRITANPPTCCNGMPPPCTKLCPHPAQRYPTTGDESGR